MEIHRPRRAVGDTGGMIPMDGGFGISWLMHGNNGRHFCGGLLPSSGRIKMGLGCAILQKVGTKSEGFLDL